jgi:hypothetical protein
MVVLPLALLLHPHLHLLQFPHPHRHHLAIIFNSAKSTVEHLQYYWVVLIIYLVGFKVVLMPYQQWELFNYFETAYFGSCLEYLAETVKALFAHLLLLLRRQFLVCRF